MNAILDVRLAHAKNSADRRAAWPQAPICIRSGQDIDGLSERFVSSAVLHKCHDRYHVTSPNTACLADVVLTLRSPQAGGRVRKAVRVLRNPVHRHGESSRELPIKAYSLRVRGRLFALMSAHAGTPACVGIRNPLMEPPDHAA